MKAIIFYISLLLSCNLINGQTCLQNGSFANACTNVIVSSHGDCPTWTDACGDGWVRSHGTPQMIFYNDGNHSGFYAFMWAEHTSSTGTFYDGGEGMFTQYSFSANHSYDVKIRISTSNAAGTVYVYAANGLTQSYYTGTCGGDIPIVSQSQKQLIGSFVGFTNGWITVTFPPFIPNSTTSYSQIWIYPLASTAAQYDLGVMDVTVCPSCGGIITYNNGIVPSGESIAGNINVGSTAGTGGVPTVTVQSNQTTDLLASNEVDILPEFNAVVTTGSFSAKIIPCTTSSSSRAYLDSINVELYQSNEGSGGGLTKKSNERIKEVNRFLLYPNPTKGSIFIQVDDGKRTSIEVYDATGRLIRKKENISGTSPVKFDLSSYETGYYLIKVIGKDYIKISKVFLER